MEEDIFNLVAHDHYQRVPNYRDLTPSDEQALLDRQYNRVTDTCIPEEEAMRHLEHHLTTLWKRAADSDQRFFPHQYIFQLLESELLVPNYQIDPSDSWVLAAYQKQLPIVVPGWEDSTLGNIFAAHCIKQEFSPQIMKSGVEYMIELADWYIQTSQTAEIGFFQIGGGIAGDFPICVVPMLHQDLKYPNIPVWGYFCQISDSTTSYGSYSGAIPNEKITWGKLAVDTPKFIIESDASIVAPLIFAHVLDW